MQTRTPKYRLHKASGQALVQINGRRIYLGKHGSDESKEKYRRLVAEWLASPAETTVNASSRPLPSPISVNELLLQYWEFAEQYYRKDGQPTKELRGVRESIEPLADLYGLTPANDFGPKSLKAVRQHMIERGWARGLINQRIGRIKRVFKWAVGEELVERSVFHGLQAVTGLRKGRTEARETEPVTPVPDEHVDAVLSFVSPQVSAMIQVQRLTGMRPGEVVVMRPVDIDRGDAVWIYEPADHKNEWRGHQRVVPIGPKAQQILIPFLVGRALEAYLFSPAQAEEWRHANRPAYQGRQRKTKEYPSEVRRRKRLSEQRKTKKSKRQKRERYDTDSYRRAISYGIKRAAKASVEIPKWHPNQLRHSRATEIRKQFGVEAAQVVLGHARADVTQVYAERNIGKAIEIARESG